MKYILLMLGTFCCIVGIMTGGIILKLIGIILNIIGLAMSEE